ncbi:MAG TPA: DUF2752 domain-containing protein [Vicinamibacterales bacterium]|nr:DUF2752 domain-containing protein [Vicinamibacterales bacterium]
MTLRWRRLAPGAADTELIVASVLTATASMAAAWLHWLGFPPIACPLRAATGIPCPTCGATHAFAALMEGRLGASFWFNPAVPLGAAIALLFVPYAFATSLTGAPRLRVEWSATGHRALKIAGLLALAALWGFLIVTTR